MTAQILSNIEVLPDQVSLNIINDGSLAHQNWYLKPILNNCYVFILNECIILVPVKQSLFGPNAFIPQGVQRLDPIYTNHQIKSENYILIEIAKLIPCGIISWSQNIASLPPGFKKQQRNNYILHLLPEYKQLRKYYSSGLKNSLNKNKHTIHLSFDVKLFVDFYLNNSNKIIPVAYKNSKLLTSIISNCIEKHCGFIKYVKDNNNNNNIIAMAFFSQYKNRIIYQYSCSTAEGRLNDAMHAILDHTILDNSGKDIYLDFEGSMIPGIAKFMQSFGAKIEYYYLYTWNIHWFCKIKQAFRNWLLKFKSN